MSPYPPYDALVLVAEQCPLCMEVFLGLYARKQKTNANPLVFDYDSVEEEGWQLFIADLKELETWDLIRFEFISQTEIEVTLPDQEINAVGKILC